MAGQGKARQQGPTAPTLGRRSLKCRSIIEVGKSPMPGIGRDSRQRRTTTCDMQHAISTTEHPSTDGHGLTGSGPAGGQTECRLARAAQIAVADDALGIDIDRQSTGWHLSSAQSGRLPGAVRASASTQHAQRLGQAALPA
ncbi:hypothetical protein PCL_03601 [Purpureocillium lilacinum]|uniref:Uncharacterized protein n=1 Tax=Purpureocillium lilacinum TaxID=33203 RepID=A0A2U3EPG6_PURLI|nr:hypothetical protein Purlil1_2415 [Purpureocillium lilacinum]PWI76407.1 hypothetical protein PCL_03601 [Purpureocillium lilacinum]